MEDYEGKVADLIKDLSKSSMPHTDLTIIFRLLFPGHTHEDDEFGYFGRLLRVYGRAEVAKAMLDAAEYPEHPSPRSLVGYLLRERMKKAMEESGAVFMNLDTRVKELDKVAKRKVDFRKIDERGLDE
jgi:hypothetical protein